MSLDVELGALRQMTTGDLASRSAESNYSFVKSSPGQRSFPAWLARVD